MPFIVPAVVVLVCIGILTWFVRDMKRARARIAGRSETLETTFGTIEYATAGEGPAILVAHGAGGGFDQGLDMTIGATGHGFQLIVPSRFGYLRSSLPQQASPAMQADAYAELLDHLGFEQVAVLGISAGAWSAVEFAARHPLRCHALLLLVPAQALPPGVTNEGGPIVRALFESDLLLWTASKLMRLAPALVAPALLGMPTSVVRSASAEERSRLQQVVDRLLPISARSQGILLDLKTAQAPQPVRFENITSPVLAISATDDAFGTAAQAQAIADAVARGQAVIYPSGGHPLVGRQADLIERITSFLRGG